MGTRERREREKEELRAQILDAARELFAEEGYDAVTMRKIAEQIEYSPTAIYFHFKDKHAVLMRELCDEDFLRLAARVPEDRARSRTRSSACGRSARPTSASRSSPRNHYRLMFMTPHPDHAARGRAGRSRGQPEEDAYAFLSATVAEAIGPAASARSSTTRTSCPRWSGAGMHGVVSLHIAKCNDAWVDWRAGRRRRRRSDGGARSAASPREGTDMVDLARRAFFTTSCAS